MALSRTLVSNVNRGVPKMIQAIGGKPKSITHEVKELSDLDNVHVARFQIPTLFFYPRATGSTKRMDPAKTIGDGLAKPLVAYYPLAGQVFKGSNNKFMVDCNIEGVVFVEADANVKLEQLGDGVWPPCPHLEELLPKPRGTSIIDSPMFSFQVTRFLCGGFSFGLLYNHALVDGSGLMQFLNAVGELANGASTPSIAPGWQRELLNARSPPSITSTHNEFIQSVSITEPLKYPEETFVRTSVFFSPRDIQALRNQIATAHPPSRFDLLTACLWKSRTVALDPNSDDTVGLTIAIDARYRKGIDLPKGYYGNAVDCVSTTSKAASLCESPLGYAVNMVQQAKAQTSGEHLRSLVDFFASTGQTNLVSRLNFMATDITRGGFDKLDLGLGKPLFGGNPFAISDTSVYNNFKNEKGEDGVVVSICLPALALEKFQYELNKMTRA